MVFIEVFLNPIALTKIVVTIIKFNKNFHKQIAHLRVGTIIIFFV